MFYEFFYFIRHDFIMYFLQFLFILRKQIPKNVVDKFENVEKCWNYFFKNVEIFDFNNENFNVYN